MTRKTPSTLVWIGSALLLFAGIPAWAWFGVPWLTRLPDDFSYQADVTSVDNFYNEETDEFVGESYSKTEFSYDVVEKENGALMIQNTFDVQTLDGKTVYKAEPIYAIDPVTGAQVPGMGDVSREGYLFAPRWLKKGDDFVSWHASSDVPLRMSFVEEETLFGLKVYQYSAQTEIDQTEALSFRPGVGETRGVKLVATNTIWIEPVTGYLVKQKDYSNDYYYYDLATGERIGPYNQFSNTFADGSVREHARIAQGKRTMVFGLTYGGSGLLVCVVVFFLALHAGAFRGSRRKFLQYTPGLLVFLSIICLALLAFYAERRSMFVALESRLAFESLEISNAIEERFHVYANTLLGGQALFNASSSVSREEWRRYVESSKIITEYSGILGMGYSAVVPPEDVGAFEESVRAEGYPDFAIRPSDPRAFYTSIVYIEPQNETNLLAFGYDMFTEPVRRTAMRTARDTGAPAASGMVQLLQDSGEDVQGSFLIYVPVYRQGIDPVDVVGRRENLMGFVYAPIHGMASVDEAVNAEEYDVDFHIYDGLKTTPDALMFTSDHEAQPPQEDHVFEDSRVIYVAGHPWTVVFHNRSDLALPQGSVALQFGTLVAGVLFALMAFGLIQSIMFSREKAVQYAKKLTGDLQKSAEELEKRNADLQEKFHALNALNQTMVDREMRMIELKNRLKRYE